MRLRTTLHAAAIALASVGLLQGCSGRDAAPPGERQFAVTGLVVDAPAGGSVSIAHEEIPGFMPPMVMPFVLADPRDESRLSRGDRVSFTLRVTDEASRAADFVVTGRDMRAADAYAVARTRESTRLRPGDPLPAFQLVDQNGAPFTEADLRGQPTVLSFIFTRCPLPEFCPLIVTRLGQVQRATASERALADTRLLSITLDPEFDTPEILEEYGASKGADFSRWRFVTGTPEQIGALTRAFAVQAQPSAGSIDHTLATALIDAGGRVVEIWRGNFWETTEILDALRRLP